MMPGLLALTGVFLIAVSPTVRAEVMPGLYEVDGNPSCAGLYEATVISGPDTDLLELGPLFGFKYDANPTGDASSTLTDNAPWVVTNGPQDPYNTVSLFNVVLASGEGIRFDWSATLGIDAVIVKAQDANAYVYVPEAFGGEGLEAPDGKAVSHVELCYDYELDASKSADAEYTREYIWQITKEFDGEYARFIGDPGWTHHYEVAVDQTVADSDFMVTGQILVGNATPFQVPFTVSDFVDGIAATVICPAEELAAGTDVICDYDASLGGPYDGTNTATVTSGNENVLGATAEADYAFGDPTTIIGYPQIQVTDTNGQSWTASGGADWTYDKQLGCPPDPALYENGVHSFEHQNTATIIETGQSDDATVQVRCYAPMLSKDASARYDRRHTWEIEKGVTPTAQSGFAGDLLAWTWKVDVSESAVDEGFAVEGAIRVTNPAGAPGAMTVSLTDQLDDGTVATVDCGGGAASLTVGPGATGSCAYGASPSDASAMLNTATGTFNGIGFTATAAVEFVEHVINGTAEVDDDQEPAFPLALTAGEGPWQWTETQAHPCAAAGDTAYGEAGMYSMTLDNLATVTGSDGQTDQASASTTVTCIEPAGAKVVKTTTEGDEAIGQLPFSFALYDPDGGLVETQTLGTGGGTLSFAAELRAAGEWMLVEILPQGWVSTTETTCSFAVAYPGSAGQTYQCAFDNVERSRVDLLKLTNGLVNPAKSWSFGLYAGPDGHGTESLATDDTLGDADGVLDFGEPDLSPFETYTLCELGVWAGYSTFWQVDTDGDGIGDTVVMPYNPNADDDPPEDEGNRCVDIGAGSGLALEPGRTLHLVVDNQYPGGSPRTPGYWKNWNACSGGGQYQTALDNGGWEEGYWLLEHVLDPAIGGGVVWDDILADGYVFPIDDCELAVLILDKRDVESGKKKASDPLINMATHLLAAQLNLGAGACVPDGEVYDGMDLHGLVLAAEQLLDQYDFDGTAGLLPKKSDDGDRANELAGILDLYNNGEFCGDSEE
jgi:hypothetical protein